MKRNTEEYTKYLEDSLYFATSIMAKHDYSIWSQKVKNNMKKYGPPKPFTVVVHDTVDGDQDIYHTISVMASSGEDAIEAMAKMKVIKVFEGHCKEVTID